MSADKLIKLNKLQAKTLVLAQQVVIAQGDVGNNEDGSVTLLRLPQPHGNHVHVGKFVVSVADFTGFDNGNVWSALQRKGLVIEMDGGAIAITQLGLSFETGLGEKFLQASDH